MGKLGLFFMLVFLRFLSSNISAVLLAQFSSNNTHLSLSLVSNASIRYESLVVRVQASNSCSESGSIAIESAGQNATFNISRIPATETPIHESVSPVATGNSSNTSCARLVPKNISVADQNLTVTFEVCCIIAGESYNVTLWSTSGLTERTSIIAPHTNEKVLSLVAPRQLISALYLSGPVTNLSVSSTFPTARLHISWSAPSSPNGEISQYFITVLNRNRNDNCSLKISINCTECTNNMTRAPNLSDISPAGCPERRADNFRKENTSLSVIINDPIIAPYTDYVVVVTAVNTYGAGTPMNITIRTAQYKSGPVVNLSVISTFPQDNLQISWAAPTDPNGTVIQYIVSVNSTLGCVLSTSLNCSNCPNVTFQGAPCPIVIHGTLFNSSDQTFSINITNPIIQPNTNFTITVLPINGYGDGTPKAHSIRTPLYSPPSVSSLQTKVNELDINVSWTPPPGLPLKYAYQLSVNNVTWPLLDNSSTTYSFKANYCSQYSICIWTITAYGNSNRTCSTTNTVSSPSWINSTFSLPQTTSINLNWTYFKPDNTCQVYFSVTINSNTTNTTATYVQLPGLQPYTKYAIQVTPVTRSNLSADRTGTHSSVTVQTAEDVPSRVNNLNCTDISHNDIKCSWSEPSQKNGLITNYLIVCLRPDGVLFNDTVTSVLTVNISGAVPDVLYRCQVRAKTSPGYGEPAYSNLTIPSSIIPHVIHVNMIADVMKASTAKVDNGQTQLAITLPYAFFTDNYGIIQMFTLVINPTDSTITNSSTIDSLTPMEKGYGDCEGKRDSCIYEIKLQDRTRTRQRRSLPSAGQPNEVYVIGKGPDCATNKYCNGPLLSSKRYQIGFRAYTRRGFITVGFIFMATLFNFVPIVIGLLVPFFLVIGAIGLYFYIRYKRNQLPDRGHTMSIFNPPLIEDSSLSNSDVCYTRSPGVHEFHAHFEFMQADSNGRMIDDFQEIKDKVRQLEIQQRLVPAEGNDAKNRYNNIKPYKYNRVKLLGQNDYINASRICTRHWSVELENQCDCTDIYIATQGPLDDSKETKLSTIGDFWRMVFENDVCVIVNLTMCTENGKEKCAQYWPQTPRTPVTYCSNGDDVEVIMQSVNENQIFAERILHISMYGRSKSVTQLHINSWLDHSCPKSSEFLQFYMNYQKVRIKSQAVVVHCSAGVGRTGTFILIDEELTRISKEADKVEIFNSLLKLRKCRCQMVQTESQYCFVYTIIRDYLIQRGLIKLPNNHSSDSSHIYRQSYENPIFNETD